MKFIIRTDASLQIGSGHVMRCLTLAEALRTSGAEVEFVCRNHSGNLNGLISKKGFLLHELPSTEKQSAEETPVSTRESNYAHWLGVSQEQDAQETKAVLQGKKRDWILVDHYGLDETWELQLRPHVQKIMVIDDLANRPHDCDVLLDQNYFIDGNNRYKDLVPAPCTRLLGPQYALLRPEFSEARKTLKARTGVIQRIFVFFGGTDPDNVTSTALKALSEPQFAHLDVDVVIGASNPHRELLEEQVAARPRTTLHVQIDNIAKLMVQADLAIGAGGATTWERLCLGLPSLVITIAENQEQVTRDLHQKGFLWCLGTVLEIGTLKIEDLLQSFLKNRELNVLQSQKGSKRVKGEGSLFIKELLTQGILPEHWSIRQAIFSDCELLWHWANDSEVRKNAFHSSSISWKKHQEWFAQKLKNPCSRLFLIESSWGAIGQVRFEQSGQHFVIDYSISRQFRGLKLGEVLLSKGIQFFKKSQEFLLIAEVKKENQASAKIFEHLDFKECPPPPPFEKISDIFNYGLFRQQFMVKSMDCEIISTLEYRSSSNLLGT